MNPLKLHDLAIQVQPGLDLQRIDVSKNFLKLIHPFRILVSLPE